MCVCHNSTILVVVGSTIQVSQLTILVVVGSTTQVSRLTILVVVGSTTLVSWLTILVVVGSTILVLWLTILGSMTLVSRLTILVVHVTGFGSETTKHDLHQRTNLILRLRFLCSSCARDNLTRGRQS